VVLCAILLHQLQVSDDQISEELDKDRIVSINLLFKVLDQFLEHFFEHGELNVVIHGQNLDRDRLVDRQDLLDCRAVVPDQNSRSFFELTLLKVSFGELHQVSVQDIRSLFFGKTETLLPLTSLREHFKT